MRSLESLRAWRMATSVASIAYKLTTSKAVQRHPSLADQIRRAALSIPANIAEGYGLGTRKQFVRGLRIAYGSALELQTHLAVARAAGVAPADTLDQVARDLDTTIGLLIGLLKSNGARVKQ